MRAFISPPNGLVPCRPPTPPVRDANGPPVYHGRTVHESPGTLVMRWLRNLGFLRALLVLTAAFIMLVSPLAYGGVQLHDWRLLPTVVAPAVMMVLVFVLLLDMLMSWIFMHDATEDHRTRLATLIRIEVAVLVAMITAWSPFLARIFAY